MPGCQSGARFSNQLPTAGVVVVVVVVVVFETQVRDVSRLFNGPPFSFCPASPFTIN